MTTEPPPGTHPLLVALVVTALAAAAVHLLPEAHSGTAVGLVFLGATWWCVLRRDEGSAAREHGLALGGLLESAPLEPRRLGVEAARALGWALLVAAVVFPPFFVGWRLWWQPPGAFHAMPLGALAGEVSGQLVGIALPEEAFYRGYLQTALDRVWRPRWRLLGAAVGPGLLVTSLVFALGHFATEPRPDRLAVFFPSLLFGWLRARSGGIGAPMALHAGSNLLTTFLSRSYFGT